MTGKSKVVVASICGVLLVGAGWLLRPRGASGSSLGQSVNAGIDNMVAVGVRLLELPVILLIVAAAILGIVLALPVLRWGTRSGQLTFARLAVGAVVGMLLVTMGLAVDYKLGRLQAEVSELRGKLNQERMAQMQGPDEGVPAVPAPSLTPSVAQATPARVGSTPGAPVTATKPVMAKPPAAKAKRDVMMVDVVQVPRSLSILFGQVGFHPMIHDEATDIVEVDVQNPPIIAYMAVVNLKTPGLEVKWGGSLTQKTMTSEFAKANDCQIAINGEAGQSPQANSGLGLWSGNMMVEGKRLLIESATNKRPFLSFDKLSQPHFTALAAADRALRPDAYNVIWGRLDAIIDGKVQTENERDRQPRTAMGINADGSKLYLMVVDGRQQRYSMGFTRGEVGTFMQVFGATNAMLCDEGGSSCMYLKKFKGIVNSPSDGEERPTYTHFGISLKGG